VADYSIRQKVCNVILADIVIWVYFIWTGASNFCLESKTKYCKL